MGKKVFISYKYADISVAPLKLPFAEFLAPTKVRDYVDEIQRLIGDDHVNKGEKDGESLKNFEDSTIESKLRDRIYDSSVTVVLISPNMIDPMRPIGDQWIPWEIAYSLREQTRNDRTSRTNGILAVVIPDRSGSYQYYIEETNCWCCHALLYRTQATFPVIGKNMFNSKRIMQYPCSAGHNGAKIFTGNHSYIQTVKWSDFRVNPDKWIDLASDVNPTDFNLVKTV